MPNKYDVIIVGMGPSSIFCAYELIKLKKFKKVLHLVDLFDLIVTLKIHTRA